MRTRAIYFGVVLLLALARPAAAQFSTSMGSTMTGSNSTGNSSTSSSFFSQVFGNRPAVPTFNFLSNFPAAPHLYGTMLGRTPSGTTPQATIVNSSPPARQWSTNSFFGKKQSN